MPSVPASITAEFCLAAPMFLGGYDPSDVSSSSIRAKVPLRVPSIKGMLRFWWRAIQWHRIRAGAGSETAALRQLHREEQALFGRAADEQQPSAGQSRVLISVEKVKHVDPSQDFRDAGYLLGQGLWNAGKSAITRTVSPIERFTLRLFFHHKVTADERESVAEALWILGLIGGLGARSRRGIGSLCLTAWGGPGQDTTSRFPIPTTTTAYREALATIAANHAQGASPPYTAFSGGTRIDVSAVAPARQNHFPGMHILAFANKAMMNFRSNGKDPNDRELPDVKAVVKRDYELMRGYLSASWIQELPRRSAFGLPHNYFFEDSRASMNYSLASQRPTANARARNVPPALGRRASPLFLHVHALPDGTCALVHTLFLGQFFPKGAEVMMKPDTAGSRAMRRHVNETDIDWPLLHRYLDAYAERDSVCGAQVPA